MSNTNLKSIIESVLFISHKALSLNEIKRATGGEKQEIKEILNKLTKEYRQENKGMIIIENDNKYQMATNPKNAKVVKGFLKKQVSDDMTPASLETLSIVAYRGPIKKQELEKIRGVNCSIIIRNLLMKGLIEEKNEDEEIYDISLEFMRRVGLSKRSELPEFEKLNKETPLKEFVNEDDL